MTEEIQNRLMEAELYASQGLEEEAREIYTELLNKLDKTDEKIKEEIKQKIENLTKESVESAPNNSNELESNKEFDLLQRFNMAVGLMEAGFPMEAIEEFKKLLDEGYRKAEVYSRIADAYLNMDMPFEAIENLEAALKEPDIPLNLKLDVLYRLALTHEKTGAVSSAIEALEQIVKIDPTYRNAKQHLDTLSQTAQKYGRFYYLIRKGLLTEEQHDEAVKLARQQKKPIENILIEYFGIDKTEIGQSLSEYYQCPFVEFNELELGKAPDCIKGIKEQFFRTNSCVPIREHNGTLLVAVDNPHDIVKIDNIRRVLKANNFQFAVALKDDINKFIDYFFGKYNFGNSKDVFEQLELVEEEEAEDEPEEDVVSDEDNVVVQMANRIIEDAVMKRASDIHIESLTGKRGCLIRFRIDGDCIKYQTVPYAYKRALISRIKILANLDIAEKRLPQDGKIKFKTRTGHHIELRVATIPTTENNEDVVLRILAGSNALPLDRIGLLPEHLERLKSLLVMPYGLILVVGPTGSGKTTTLHAALGYLNRPEKKIWTAEDPVEIVQDGLRQVQVKPSIGLTFARVLRAFLRADPDIIMVGETRDEETANTIIEASLTGHLVFSTLHTNTAPETVTRLLGMGMDPFNFADALLGVLSQRLVKRLCSHCKEPYTPSDQELELLVEEYGEHPTTPLDPEKLKNVTLFKAKGCAKCNMTGYRGRLAIHELLVANDELRLLIQKKAPVAEIRKQAMENGMITLKQDGIHKVLAGETDLRQVRSACIR